MKSNANEFFKGVESSKNSNKRYYEEKKQRAIKQYNDSIKQVEEIDFVDALHGLGAIRDVVSYKEKENYMINYYPIYEYDLGNTKVPYNIIYLCKETEQKEAIEEIKSRINDGTTYEPNDKYIFLGSFLGDRLYDKFISFNPNSKINNNKQIKGQVFDERFNYINDFMSQVSGLKLSGEYKDIDDLYQLAFVYGKPYERKREKKINKVKRLLLKR